MTTTDDVSKGLVEWLCAQLKKPSHPSRAIPTAINCLATLLKEPMVRSLFVQAHGVKLLIPLISPASTQQSMQDLLEALNQREDGLKDNIKKMSSFDKYKQEVLLGHLDWSPMHKDPIFWLKNITKFEENDFQILRVHITILDTSRDPRALVVACFDLSQFIQYHPAGRVICDRSEG
ncbi:hypothetical protein Vadar_001687 [Vaccinium darrowii]|uniref:Uncharacterized protein n=1 Tax=Vaccinium darrowii TaxID=229202 RepID=A0ACB7WX62_9ERIC|nr:hypothetical protein Vadar_001687 [Vaccinium darrowii]